MAAYRLEIWFDFGREKCDWGIAKTTSTTDTTPFASGGSEVNKNSDKKKVAVSGGANSPFDIYLFDNSASDQQRQLQWFALDYEVASDAPTQTNDDPIGYAETLRGGVTGNAFMGDVTNNGSTSPGMNGTTAGVGNENQIRCARNAQAVRRWSLNQGYTQNLTAGNYSFTIAFVIGSPNEKQVKAFGVDPEMDIQN